jgi:DNA-binding SARP family transcriptional activator
VTEDTLFEAFWPDKDPAAGRRNLQVVLSLLRAVLDPPGAERGVVEVSERTYRLALRPGDTVDADAFLAAADAAASAPEHARAAALERAAELWGGEPLPEDRYAAWSTAWREELVGRYADVLAELAAAYRAAGERPAAMHAARRLVELDPLNERAQRTLMRAYAAAGRRAHALRQYLECRRAMVDELGVEPSAETVRLHARILAGDPV